MNGFTSKKFLCATILGSALALAATDANAQGKILRADTDAQGASGNTMIIVASKIWKRELGVTVQINDSQTLTRSALKLGTGKLEIMPLPTSVGDFLSKGSRMYAKKFKKQAIAASKKIRSLYGWLAVYSHGITFEDSGILKYADIKGKRVYTGPASGGASVAAEGLIRAVTGYEPKKDYEVVRMPWGSGLQAMLDGKLDVYMRPSGVGSSAIEQLGLKKKFRLLDASEGNKAGFKKFTSPPWRRATVIPANSYRSQINNDKDVVTSAGSFQVAVAGTLSDDMAYKMTKAIWDNLKEVKQTAVVLSSLNPAEPFTGINTKLHNGAIKFYKEKGIKIPAHLM